MKQFASERARCAARIQIVKEAVAVQVTGEFLVRHPDWLQRYGERAQAMGVQDAVFHLDFLCGAIEAGAPDAFADYARWCARMLQARGIAPAFLDENLRQIGAALSDSIADGQEMVAEMVAAGCAALAGMTAAAPRPDGPLGEVRRVFTQAAIRGDRRAAATIALEALRQGTAVVDLYTHVFEPSQFDIGRSWEANTLSVAEEHVATAVTQYVMAVVYGEAGPSAATRGRIMITGVAGELHQIAGNMVADVLALDGWDVRFLGSNLPDKDIIRELAAYRPAVLGVSATMLFNLPKVTALVKAVQAAVAAPPRIIVGGAAFRHCTGVPEEIGCDGYGFDLTAARLLAARFGVQA